MRRAYTIGMGFLVVSAVALARDHGSSGTGVVPLECEAIPAPSAEALAQYAQDGPYSSGVRRFLAGRYRETARDLAGAWKKVRADLAKVFSTSSCDPGRIRAVLTRNLFRSPPLVVPGDDRFLPPPVVRQALARSLCMAGRVQEATDVLWEAAMAGDEEARASAGVLFAATDRADVCLALGPEEPGDPAAMLARAYCLARSGRASEASILASRAGAASGPRIEILRRLVRFATTSEAPPAHPEAP